MDSTWKTAVLLDKCTTCDCQDDMPRYKGVCLDKEKGVWRARFYCKGNHITLGRYRTAELAALAHDFAAVYVFGDRAVLNFSIDVACDERQFSFGRNTCSKLTALRQVVRQDHTFRAQRPCENQAKAIRTAAANTAFREVGLAHSLQSFSPYVQVEGKCAPVNSAQYLSHHKTCKVLVLAAVRSSSEFH